MKFDVGYFGFRQSINYILWAYIKYQAYNMTSHVPFCVNISFGVFFKTLKQGFCKIGFILITGLFDKKYVFSTYSLKHVFMYTNLKYFMAWRWGNSKNSKKWAPLQGERTINKFGD